MHITLGSDPELFVTKGGKFRSAYGLIPGTKKEPHPVENGMVQIDGVALEIGITATDDEDTWVNNHKSVLKQLRDMVPEEYEFALVPACKFNFRHLNAQPDEAKELGCDPDFNAYTLEANPRPNAATTLRTASGHVHIGFCEDADITDPAHIQRCATLVKQLDCYLGIPSVYWDHDEDRRKLYGKAGAFRPKPYGVEYRVLSNAWLKDENLMRFVFRGANLAVEKLLGGQRPFLDIGEARVADQINKSARFTGSFIKLPGIADIKPLITKYIDCNNYKAVWTNRDHRHIPIKGAFNYAPDAIAV